jgi:hypothetical protein
VDTKRKVVVGIAGLVILIAAILKFLLPLVVDSPPTESEIIRSAIDRSAKYLLDVTNEDGTFVYRINMDPRINVSKKYNILRHAGTIYSMTMYYHMQPDVEMRAAIERAGGYLRDQAIGPVPETEDMLAVWSDPEVNGTGDPLQAKLGGTGLGLVALLSVEKIYPGFTSLSELQAMGRFIQYMQKEDGSFYSKYFPSQGGRNDEWVSLYYPGEAALGLLMLYEADPSGQWLGSAYRALEYLALSRENSTDIPVDHWALLATNKILSFENTGEVVISRELLINHAIQICESILDDQINNQEWPAYDGGFSPDGRTTPTATRIEGIQAALEFLPNNHEIRGPLNNAVERGISFLLRAQITEGDYEGGYPRAVGYLVGDSEVVQNFNRHATEVRIDYVQHAMSAMIKYLQEIN